MATSQPTLDEIAADPRVRRQSILAGRGAVYGQGRTERRERVETNVCLNCEADIPSDIARGVGDNHGRVRRCKHCTGHKTTTVAQRRATDPDWEVAGE